MLLSTWIWKVIDFFFFNFFNFKVYLHIYIRIIYKGYFLKEKTKMLKIEISILPAQQIDVSYTLVIFILNIDIESYDFPLKLQNEYILKLWKRNPVIFYNRLLNNCKYYYIDNLIILERSNSFTSSFC